MKRANALKRSREQQKRLNMKFIVSCNDRELDLIDDRDIDSSNNRDNECSSRQFKK